MEPLTSTEDIQLKINIFKFCYSLNNCPTGTTCNVQIKDDILEGSIACIVTILVHIASYRR